jgi:hypothetical protein
MSSISLRVRLMFGILGCGSARKALRPSGGNFIRPIAAKLGTSALPRVCSGETRWQLAHQRLAMISPFAASAAKAPAGTTESRKAAITRRKRYWARKPDCAIAGKSLNPRFGLLPQAIGPCGEACPGHGQENNVLDGMAGIYLCCRMRGDRGRKLSMKLADIGPSRGVRESWVIRAVNKMLAGS